MKGLVKKPLVLVLSLVSIFALVIILSKSNVVTVNPQLAQIIDIEIDLLKQWQRENGLSIDLSIMSRGSDVTLLQKMLSQDESIYPEKIVTGYFGDLTKGAVLEFQSQYDLQSTGVVDKQTRSKLNEIFLSHLCPDSDTMYPDLSLQKVSKEDHLPLDYVPSILENISNNVKTLGTTCLRKDAAGPLKDMMNDAKKDGVNLMVTSGYRKPEIQKHLYDYWIKLEGSDAFDEIAEPGASEHQLGTTVDFTDESIGYSPIDDNFANSEGGKWLVQNAHKYGWTMSYSEGSKEVTGYEYEPWHWRYVGEDIAVELKDKNITFSELDI